MITTDYRAELFRDYPAEFPHAEAASEEVVRAIDGVDLSALSRHSPGLSGFDWSSYLRLSTIRMVRALRQMRRVMPDNSHVADVGAYFGNFSIMFADAGYRVTAIDSYSQYGQCFSPILKLFHSRGVGMMERLDLSLSSEKQHFDAVLLMGVIEHIPHTPRALLEAIFESLKPGGVLILDTPNLGYVYNRQRLARGESIFPAIQSQFWTEIPFEGHHREYTRKELEWMLDTVGLEIQSVDAFNYSLYSIPQLSGIDLENFELMESDESMRELLMMVARRPD